MPYKPRDLDRILDLAARFKAGDASVREFRCLGCGESFLTESNQSVVSYCSKHCNNSHRRWLDTYVHRCAREGCTNWWRPRRGSRRMWQRKFCSQACRLRSWRQGHPLLLIPTRIRVRDLIATE